MPSRLMHLPRLGLLARLAGAAAALVLVLAMTLLASFARQVVERHEQAAADRIDTGLSLLTQALRGRAGTPADMAPLLRSIAQRTGIDRVVWTDAHGNAQGADGAATRAVAPNWFAVWSGVTGQTAGRSMTTADGTTGTLWVRMHPHATVDPAWHSVVGATRLATIGVLVLLLPLGAIAWFGMRPLAELEQALRRVGAGEHGVRLEERGSAEVEHAIDAFNTMAAQIEEALQTLRIDGARTRRLAMIVEQTDVPIITCDHDGAITSWNRAAEQMYGWSVQDVLGRTAAELHLHGLREHAQLHGRSRDTGPGEFVDPVVGRAWSDGTWSGEMVRATRTGQLIHISGTRAPLVDENGHPVGWIGVSRDIGDLKAAQAALRVANQRLEQRVAERTADLRRAEGLMRAVMDAMPGAIGFQDPQRRFLLFNRKLEELLQRPADAIRGRTPAELMRPENAQVSRAYMDRAQAGESVRFEWTFHKDDGSAIEHETRFVPVHDDQGDIAGVAAFSVDITERKRAEVALRETASRNRMLATMVDRSADSIHARDLDGNVTYWNHAAERLTGYSAAEAIGQPLRSLHLRTRTEGELEAVLQRIRAGLPTEFESPRVDRTGRKLDIASRTAPLFDDDGNLSGEVIVMRDVTAAKNAQRELLRAKEAAESANRAKSEFLANMSHEIRTPLNAVLGMTDLVLDSELSREQRADLELVRSAGNSLLSLINDILDFSKIEAGHLQLEAIAFAPADSIADMVRMLAPRTHQKGIELIYEAHDLPAQLLGDVGRLRQVVVNLLGNAIKFTEHGEIAVTVRSHPDPLDLDGTVLLEVSVRDTGIGIAPEHQSVIFQAFTQADASTTRRYGGTGLGLAISARLARLMGGELRVESRPGIGSTFTLTIRCAPVHAASALALRPPRDRALLEGRSVLVVEDNANYLSVLQRMLAGWGMHPTPASDGETALGLLREARDAGHPYPLVILDLVLPGIDGFVVARQALAQPPLAGAVIMLTAASRRGHGERCREIGVAGYLTKPAQPSELFDAIAAVLGREAQPAAASVDAPAALITRHSLRETRRAATILVAEDNETNQLLAMRVLGKLGHRAQLVVNGQEAVEATQREPFDLVLMDMQMPVMGGLEAAAAIRSREAGTSTRLPIIALTANAMQSDRESCLAAGMDDHLTKPFSADQLAAVLARWLPDAADRVAATTLSPGLPDEGARTVRVRNTEPARLDIDILKSYVGDEPADIEEFLRSFLDGAANARLTLRDAHRERREHTLHGMAHQLKSGARTVGALGLGTLCEALETAARTHDWDAIDAAMTQLDALLDAATADALAWLAEHVD